MATTKKAPKLSQQGMEQLLAKASTAGENAFRSAQPTPMVVGTPRDIVGSLTGGDGGGLDPDEDQWFVSEGCCGSGGISVRPGTSRFARWLVKQDVARTDSYYGGVFLSVWQLCGDRYSQSYERWNAASEAIAAVLREAGITAYNRSWID